MWYHIYIILYDHLHIFMIDDANVLKLFFFVSSSDIAGAHSTSLIKYSLQILSLSIQQPKSIRKTACFP